MRVRISPSSSALLQQSVPVRVSTAAAPAICPWCLTRSHSSRARQSKRHFSSSQQTSSAWAAAVSKIQATVADVLPSSSGSSNATGNVTIDPLKLVAKELKFLNKNIRQLLGSGHPVLATVAKYYTQSEGKHVRPLLVLLMAQATAFAAKQPRYESQNLSRSSIDTPISSPAVLYDNNPDQA